MICELRNVTLICLLAAFLFILAGCGDTTKKGAVLPGGASVLDRAYYATLSECISEAKKKIEKIKGVLSVDDQQDTLLYTSYIKFQDGRDASQLCQTIPGKPVTYMFLSISKKEGKRPVKAI